jgi:hypothetical protein
MAIDSTDKNEGNSFEYRLKELSDEEIVSILRFRDHYQPQAQRDAIKEALRRGIISSIDDLNNEEFKQQPIPSKSIFPVSMVEAQNQSVFKSLCRICYAYGIFPLIFGILKIIENRLILGIVALALGISILYVTYMIDKEKKLFLSQLLLALNVPAIGFAIYQLATTHPSAMDVFVIILIISILLYTTLYINKLILRFNRKLFDK